MTFITLYALNSYSIIRFGFQTKMTQFKVCQFKNNLVESYFADGSKISWQNSAFSYFSPMGNKTKINLDDLKTYLKSKSQDEMTYKTFREKIVRILEVCNRYNDHIIVNQFEGERDLNKS